tara:strand:+ start:465 stop:821 length:357 start_codon:yes stop_codon:yes gene_type:complete
MSTYFALVIGAVLGASMRYFVASINLVFFGIPFATVIVNIVGSALAGFFLNKFYNTSFIFLYVGIFGSFTTLSSFNIELFQLLNDSFFLKALVFFILNILISFIMFYFFYMLSIKFEN